VGETTALEDKKGRVVVHHTAFIFVHKGSEQPNLFRYLSTTKHYLKTLSSHS